VKNPDLQKQYNEALAAILNNEAVRDKDNFRLFVLGYAQFFKINDPSNGDACDQISWSALCQEFSSRHNRYYVTTRLRQDINDLVLYLNNLIATTVSNYAKNDPRVLYVDIDGAFENRRFCQIPDGDSISTGYEESWFWRGPLWSDFVADDASLSSSYSAFWNATTQLDPALLTDCSSLDSPSSPSAPWDVQLECQLQEQGQPVASVGVASDPPLGGPGGGPINSRGEALRTFHPTADGHTAICQALVEAINQEHSKSSFIEPS